MHLVSRPLQAVTLHKERVNDASGSVHHVGARHDSVSGGGSGGSVSTAPHHPRCRHRHKTSLCLYLRCDFCLSVATTALLVASETARRLAMDFLVAETRMDGSNGLFGGPRKRVYPAYWRFNHEFKVDHFGIWGKRQNRTTFCRTCPKKWTCSAGAGPQSCKTRDPQPESRFASRLDR
ncbi:hypothetical protein D3C71_1054040 [compost metagenome]